MGRNPVETVLGAVVLLVAAMFLAFAYNNADLKKIKGYEISAAFTKVGGLTVGSDVRISGIKVGTVLSQALDPVTYNAVVKLSISPTVKLPADTVAVVASDGLLGGKFVKLEPGMAKEFVAEGGKLAKTRDYKALEDLVGEIIFLATEDIPQKPAEPKQ